MIITKEMIKKLRRLLKEESEKRKQLNFYKAIFRPDIVKLLEKERKETGE